MKGFEAEKNLTLWQGREAPGGAQRSAGADQVAGAGARGPPARGIGAGVDVAIFHRCG